MDKSATLLGDFNTHFSVIDRTSMNNISKDTDDLKYTINSLNIIGIYGTLPSNRIHLRVILQYAWDVYQIRPNSES